MATTLSNVARAQVQDRARAHGETLGASVQHIETAFIGTDENGDHFAVVVHLNSPDARHISAFAVCVEEIAGIELVEIVESGTDSSDLARFADLAAREAAHRAARAVLYRTAPVARRPFLRPRGASRAHRSIRRAASTSSGTSDEGSGSEPPPPSSGPHSRADLPGQLDLPALAQIALRRRSAPVVLA